MSSTLPPSDTHSLSGEQPRYRALEGQEGTGKQEKTCPRWLTLLLVLVGVGSTVVTYFVTRDGSNGLRPSGGGYDPDERFQEANVFQMSLTFVSKKFCILTTMYINFVIEYYS